MRQAGEQDEKKTALRKREGVANQCRQHNDACAATEKQRKGFKSPKHVAWPAG